MLSLTDKALERFKKILKEQGYESYGIRIFSAGAGCCGPSLALDMVEQAMDGDVTVEKDGLKVFIEKDANETLSTATMDFTEQRGFVLNGTAEHTCDDGSCDECDE
jgi:iron-sulfur cluster assembly accessory protein